MYKVTVITIISRSVVDDQILGHLSNSLLNILSHKYLAFPVIKGISKYAKYSLILMYLLSNVIQ